MGGLAVRLTTGPSGHTISPHPSSREGHHSTAQWNSGVLLWSLILKSGLFWWARHTSAAEVRAEVLAKLTQSEMPSLVGENRRLHRYMVEGVPVEVRRSDGSIGGEQVRLIDFDDPDASDWLAVNQFTVIENKVNRRADVVIFVNGLPLGVIELKNPGDENATLDGAFNQLQTYKTQTPSLFRTNGALVISDGIAARIDSLTADRERFMPWRTVTGDDLVPRGWRRCSRECSTAAASSTF